MKNSSLIEEISYIKFLLTENEDLRSDIGYGMVALEVPKEIMNSWGYAVKVPHITFCYFPKINLFQLIKISRIVQKIMQDINEVEITTSGKDWFGPEKDTRVVLVNPTKKLLALRNRIDKEIEKEYPGIISRKFKEFKPHITIGMKEDKIKETNNDTTFKTKTLIVGIKDNDTFKIIL